MAARDDMVREGEAMAVRPNWKMRMMNRMGFRYPFVHLNDETAETFEGGWLYSDTMVVIDWKDRLRILLTGRCQIASRTYTDVPVRRMLTVTDFAVPPNRWKP